MGALNFPAIILSNGYTDDTAVGMGAVKGANCTILSIDPITVGDLEGNKVTFQWTATNGTTRQLSMNVMNGKNGINGKNGEKGADGQDGQDGADGENGISVVGFTMIDDYHFVWDFSDGTQSDPVAIPSGAVDISAETGNALVKKADGLYVATTGVEISAKEGNALVQEADGLYVPVTSETQISEQEGNAIEKKEDGIYVPSVAETKISEAEGNTIEKKEDGIYVPKPEEVKISEEENNILEKKDDGLFVPKPEGTKISADENNAIEPKEDGIFAPKVEVPAMDEKDLTFEEMFGGEELDPYHGNGDKTPSTEYVYNAFNAVVPKLLLAIRNVFDLAGNITYNTVNTYADLLAVDTSTFETGIYLYLVKQDENYPRTGAEDAYYSTIYIYQSNDDESVEWQLVGKLNVSEKMIEASIVAAIQNALFVIEDGEIVGTKYIPTSKITKTITEESTDEQITTAKAMFTELQKAYGEINKKLVVKEVTKEYYDALPDDETGKLNPAIIWRITDAGTDAVVIKDTEISKTSAWSSYQVNENLDSKVDKNNVLSLSRKPVATTADDLEDGFVIKKSLANAPINTTDTVSYKTVTYSDSNLDYRVQEATINNTSRKFIRHKAKGVWNAWLELATMDNVAPKSVFNLMSKTEDKYFVLPTTGQYLLLTTHESSNGLNSLTFYNANSGKFQAIAGGSGFTWSHADGDNRWLNITGASGNPNVYYIKLQ